MIVGRGSYTWMLTDDDGDLRDDPLDPFEIVATGTVSEASYTLSARLQPEDPPDPISSLGSALHAGQNLMINSSTVTASTVISSNGNVMASGSAIAADVQAAGLISGDTFGGLSTPGVDAFDMPMAWVFDQYVAQGTPISIGSISNNKIKHKVLSPASNPYGPVNPLGIYVIECGGQDLEIRKSRIVGTLVLLNAGSDTRISATVCFEPALPNYPSLLVHGDLRIDVGPAHLDEDVREPSDSTRSARRTRAKRTPTRMTCSPV